MAIEDVINDYLIAQSEITDIVSPSNIDQIESDTNSYPKIIYVKIDSPELYQSTDQWQRWRFFIVSPARAELNNVTDVLTDALNRAFGDFSGMYIDFIQKLNEGQITLRDDQIYESFLDFRILYH